MTTIKIFWDTNEVADRHKVKASTIRFYEKEFDLQIRRTKGGDRQFTKDDLEKIDKIFYLVEEVGLTLEKAKERFKQREKFLPEKERILASLNNFKEILLEIKNEL